ncbi:WD repeat-containing protein 1-like [Diadema antillarum]|uniref:WD repeat-containing protein 1-like n=2 Tax=Diadema antillarum TaxID=105358 RepID=UPI003A875579
MPPKLIRKTVLGSTPETTRGARCCLTGDPKGKNFLYVNGKSVFIRDIENPVICDVYNEHQYATTYAKYTPSGFYIASSDKSGKVRIWDTVNKEHVLYKEYQPISGAIRDIAFTEDSKRMIVVGEGRDKYGAAFLVDTGTSVGAIDSLTKTAISCDIRQCRPYRAVVGSDAFKVNFYQGPPFKFHSKHERHAGFVHCVRFSTNGALFASASSDKTCYLYDGATGEFKRGLAGDAQPHDGGIYCVSWSPDSTQLLTSSGDRTVKIWDVETGQAVTTFKMGDDKINDQQVACLWQNKYLLTLSLNGNISYLDPDNPSKPIRIIKGHQKAVKSIAATEDKSKVYAGSYDGITNLWDIDTGEAIAVEGSDKPSLLSQISYCEKKLSTCGIDDVSRTVEDGSFHDTSCKLDSQPQGIVRGAGNLAIVAGIEKITVVRNDQKVSVLDVPFKATSVDLHPNQSEVAVGAEDGTMYIYTLASDTLTPKTSFKAIEGEIVRCRYSPDGEYLVGGSTGKFVELWKVQDDYKPVGHVDYRHYTKVHDVAWSPDSRHYASTSMDGSVYIWDVNETAPLIQEKAVHGRSETNSVQWVSENTIVTGGGNCCLVVSDVEY